MRVVASCGPGDRHVGELLLAEMFKQIPEKQVHWRAITSSTAGAVGSADPRRVEYIEPPLELIHYPNSGLVSKSIGFLRRLWAYERFARKTASHLAELLLPENAEPTLIIADSTAVIDCAYYSLRRRFAPFRLQVWDDVRHLASVKHLDEFSSRRLFKRFCFLLAHAMNVAVISEQMAAEYQSRGAKSCVIIRHGLNSPVAAPPLRGTTETFRIGFCGSAYATDAWNCLLRGLESTGWSVLSRPVELWVVGAEASFIAGQPMNARFWGRRSMEETTKLMAECDLLYMPQSFQKHHDALTRWSFPTKLSTYVATGRPVFFHTPTWGSLHAFATQHGFSLVCDSLNPEHLVNALLRLNVEPSLLRTQGEVSVRIANTVLSHGEFRRQTRAFLGLEG
jgi:hypothetical protein